MKYLITAQAFKGTKPVGEPRVEEVDTKGAFKPILNALEHTKGIPLIYKVREAYESFWNDVPTVKREFVVVTRIEEKPIQ